MSFEWGEVLGFFSIMKTLVWVRNDLRVLDNPALCAAVAGGGEVGVVYVLEEGLGAAAGWWLHHSLAALGARVPLTLRRGKAEEVIGEMIAAHGVERVVFNKAYDGTDAVPQSWERAGARVEALDGGMLHDPATFTTQTGGNWKVFTPFWKALRPKLDGMAPLPAPDLRSVTWMEVPSERLEDWGLLPVRPDWAAGWGDHWVPGEEGAWARLEAFMHNGLAGYAVGRDRPDLAHTSRLSAALRFGEISARSVVRAVLDAAGRGDVPWGDAEKFLAEVGWREFARHLLHHFPALPVRNWKGSFDAYPWREAPADVRRWQRGETGYPLVDAGMRELWRTGWMHNRVRMVCASFLIKHLRVDWRVGERWFWDTLVDADAANNAAGWQWVAGSGADASPYFRIFNPMEQGRRYDPAGAYVRRWCPELAGLSDDVIFAPWEASPLELAGAGVVLGSTYPLPMVEHRAARAAALAGYGRVRG